MKNKQPFRVVLYEPRIPQNTGNIARTCAAFNLNLELIEPLGFSLEDKYLKRAGLDYWPLVKLIRHTNFNEFNSTNTPSNRLIGVSRYGGIDLKDFIFKRSDVLLFGREDNGLPNTVREKCNSIITIPMPGGSTNKSINGVRSLNLSVAFGLVIYEAGRKLKCW